MLSLVDNPNIKESMKVNFKNMSDFHNALLTRTKKLQKIFGIKIIPNFYCLFQFSTPTFGTVNQKEFTYSFDSALIVQSCNVQILLAIARPKPDLAWSFFSFV